MIDITKATHRSRLFESIKSSYKSLATFRFKRSEMIRDYAGEAYPGDLGASDENRMRAYINLMLYAAETYSMLLAAHNPQVDVTTDQRSLQRFARVYKLGVNNLIKEIRLNETLQECVKDAFFSMGIAKVYLADSGVAHLEGIDSYVDPGKPYVERISLDDWFHDSTVSSWRRISYCGDKYKIPISKLEDSLYDQKIAKKLVGDHQSRGDEGEGRASDHSVPEDIDDLEPSIWLMDVFLPHQGVTVTWPWVDGSQSLGEPLSVQDWDGPEGGPYETLKFCDVPDNLMPSAIGPNLRNLSHFANSLIRRMVLQARKKKRIGLTRNAEDATRMMRAKDGDVINSTPGIDEVTLGGIDPELNAMFMQSLSLFSREGGNLDAMAGLGSSAETLGQERFVQGSVGQKVSTYIERTKGFTERIVRKLGSIAWNDQVLHIPGTYQPPGTSVEIQSDWEPGVREGDFLQYNFHVDPYSMRYRTQEEKSAGIQQFMQFILPLVPLIQQQGGAVDIQELVDIQAELLSLPRLKQIIKFDRPTEVTETTGPSGSGAAGPTTREYIRRNAGGGDPLQQAGQQMQQAASSGAMQNG